MTREPTGAISYGACSVNLCPRTATHVETGETEHWLVTIRYCDEHAREIATGTPIGPLGINSQNVGIEPKGTSVPRVDRRLSID